MTPAIALSAPDPKMLRTFLNTLAAAAALLALPAVLLAAEGSYSYVRTVEGSARLLAAGAAPAGERPEQLEINQPILTGDQLLAASRSRLDIELSDGNLLRVDGDSELVFDQLAGSGDGNARSTLLRLENGEIQMVVVEDSIGQEFPRVDTANATVYLQSAGTFLVTAAAPDWTTVVVREGSAEVVTRSGSWSVGAGEELRIEGNDRARASLVQASARTALERWGQRLDAEVAAATYRHVDPSLRYAAAPLERHGSWYNTGGRYAWRPSVGLEWRPYTDGRWVYTPSGLTWVSSEPWGWATSHYGGWDYVSGYGWSWFPGRTYAPAWVYWYWANDYVAWVPTAYYTRFYRGSYGDRFRWGTYGWAGGGWHGFNDWTFCPTRYFGHRDSRRYCLPGSQARQRWNLREVPRGIVATDTRPITPDRWHKPIDAIAALERNGRDTRPGKPGADGALPDVSDFVARRPELTPEVVRTVVERNPEIGGTRGVRDRETRMVDVNGQMEPRLATNVLTPGHTSEDGKPPSPTASANPDFRLATPRDSRGGSGDVDSAAPGNQPASGDWRTVRPTGAAPVGKTPRPTRERIAVPSSPAPGVGAQPGAPVSETPSETQPVERKPRAATPPAGDSWREGDAVRSTATPKPTRSREATPAAPVGSASPRSDDWRQPAARQPVAAPRGKPVGASPSTYSTPIARTPRPSEARPEESGPAVEDWRARDSGDEAPAPRARAVSPRDSGTPAPERTEAAPVRRIMDGVGVGMGRPARTQPTPAPTPRASSSRSSPPASAPPTAKPAERRPSSPPPSTERRERSSSRESGERRAKDRNNDSDPPR